jgi:hypothetical protein
MTPPNPTTPMSRLNLILLPSMLALVSPGWAASGEKPGARPLNLSVPRDALHTPDGRQVDATVEGNLRAPAPPRATPSPSHPAALPYGAGYEHRHQGIGGQEAGTGGGAGPGGGAGHRGR